MSPGTVAVVCLAWFAGGTVALTLAARYVQRIIRELYGPDWLDWPDALALLEVCLPILAGLAGLGAVVSYAAALALGSLPLWSLVVPSLGVAYGVHRAQVFVAGKRAERDGKPGTRPPA